MFTHIRKILPILAISMACLNLLSPNIEFLQLGLSVKRYERNATKAIGYSLEVGCRHPMRNKLEAALSHHLWQPSAGVEEGSDLLSIRLLLYVPAWHLWGNSTTEQEGRLV